MVKLDGWLQRFQRGWIYYGESDPVARRQLRRRRKVFGDDDGDHRIAAGHRMVREEQNRIAAGWNLKGPCDGALAGQLALATAGQGLTCACIRNKTDTDPVRLLRHVPLLA